MSLVDRLGEAAPAKRGGRCRVAVILDALGESDRVALFDALWVPKEDPARLSAQGIADALASEGFPVHPKTIQIHRKGGCSCEPVGQTCAASA